ncbi:hypothetical protein B5S32_g123 [[Candida] boidinii]|nr:hypothetical protein B5S32_g123 [[Candida] boidinii]
MIDSEYFITANIFADILSKLILKLDEKYEKNERENNPQVKQNDINEKENEFQGSSLASETEPYDSTTRFQTLFPPNTECPQNKNFNSIETELQTNSEKSLALKNKNMDNSGPILLIPKETVESSSSTWFTYNFYKANESFLQLYGIDKDGNILNNNITKELNTMIKYDLIDINNFNNIESEINNILKICRYLIQWRCKTNILPLKLIRYLLQIFKFYLVKLTEINETRVVKVDFEILESLFIVYNKETKKSENYYAIYDLIINYYHSIFKYYFEHYKIHNDPELYETTLSRILKFIQFLILSKLSTMELLQLPNSNYCYKKSPIFQTVITKSFRRHRRDKSYMKLRKSYCYNKIDSDKIYTIIYYLVKLIQKIWGLTDLEKITFFKKLRFELLASLTFYQKYDLIRIVLNLT